MSLLTAALLYDRYQRARLNVAELGEQLGLSRGAVLNQISAGTFPIPTYLDAGKRWADIRDVAAYLDQCRERAA